MNSGLPGGLPARQTLIKPLLSRSMLRDTLCERGIISGNGSCCITGRGRRRVAVHQVLRQQSRTRSLPTWTHKQTASSNADLKLGTNLYSRAQISVKQKRDSKTAQPQLLRSSRVIHAPEHPSTSIMILELCYSRSSSPEALIYEAFGASGCLGCWNQQIRSTGGALRPGWRRSGSTARVGNSRQRDLNRGLSVGAPKAT